MPAVDLQVPYAKKDAAKALGARWDSDRKTWYAPDGARLDAFAEWMTAAVWLAQNAGGASKKLSMSKAAIKTRARKAGKPAGARIDASGGRITVGANYVPQVGAVGPPWD